MTNKSTLKSTILFILILIAKTGFSQIPDCDCSNNVPLSFIPNCSFEEHNCCPSGPSEMYCAQQWYQASIPTSDYFNTCGNILPGIINAGIVPFPDGEGAVGALFKSGWQEYIGANLTFPLTAGITYKLQFNIAYTSITGTGESCDATFSDIDIVLFGNEEASSFPLQIYGCPADWTILGSSNYTPSSNWGTLEIIFTPQVDMHSIMIGSPCDLPTDYNDSNYGCIPYFLFDNLLLNTLNSFAEIELNQTGFWCSDEGYQISTNSDMEGEYQWYLNENLLPGETSASILANTYGFGTYTIVISNEDGCCSASYHIDDIANPDFQVEYTPPSCLNSCDATATCIIEDFPTSTEFFWSNGANSLSINDLCPGEYSITVINEQQCESTQTINIPTGSSYYISNLSDSLCDATNENYIVSFQFYNANNELSDFYIDTELYNNTYYETIPSGSPYNIDVTDWENCMTINIQGNHTCGCSTNAGSFNSYETIHLCTDECFDGSIYNNDYILDSNDTLIFILHDGGNPRTVFATSTSPDFCYNSAPGIETENTYYITSIAGNTNGTSLPSPSENCYDESADKPIIWHEYPIAYIPTNETSVCGKEISLSANTPESNQTGTWSADNAFYINNNDNSTPQIDVSAGHAGTYIFTWTVSHFGCQSHDTQTVHFNPNPVAYAGEDIIICGSSAILNAASSIQGSEGYWTGEGLTFFNISDPETQVSITNPIYQTYTATWTEISNNCTDSDDVNITFLKTPEPNIINNNDTICHDEYQLHAENVQFDGIWRAFDENQVQLFPVFSDITSPDASVIIPNYNGHYLSVRFVWTESNYYEGTICQNSASTTVVFAKKPHAFISNSFVETCGNSYTLNADTSGCGWASGLWSCSDISATFDNPNIPNTSVHIDPIISFGDSASRQIPFYWTVRNLSCYDTDTALITLYKEPIANAGIDNIVCDLSYNLEAFYSIPESNNYTPEGYWENVDGNPGSVNIDNIDSNNTIVNVGTEGEYTFVWREINEHYPSCESTDTVVITFKEIPEIFAGEDFDVCGQDACLSAVSTGYTFTWQQTPGASFDDQTLPGACVHYGGYGPVDFYILESNDECVSADTVTVTFWRTPTAAEAVAAHDTLACGLEFTRLRANNPGEGVTGYWISVPSNGVTFYNQSYDDTVSVLNFGDYDFYWVESTGPDNAEPDFCTDTSEVVPVVFVEVPVANAGLDTIFCGLEGQMNAEFSVAGSTGSWIDLTSNVDFEDYTNPETPVSSNIYTSDDNSYFDLVWTENNMTCTDADTVRVEFARIPIATVTVIPPRCEGEAASILANDDDLVGYSWNWNGGIVDSTWEANAHGGFYRHLVRWNNDDTVHSFELTTENEWGCISLGTIGNVYEPYRPEYIVASYPDTCALGLGGFRLDPDTTTVTDAPGFSWINLDGETEALVIGDTTFNVPAGTYTAYHSYNTFNNSYTAQYIDLFGTQQCRDTFDLLVDTAGLVYAEIAISSATDMNALVAPNAEVWFDNLSDGDNVRTSCTWYFGDGESTNSCDDQISHVYTEPNECYEPYFVIRVKNLPECRDTAFLECIEIDDMSLLEIPNVFTPNGDGMNDFFQVKAQTLQSFQGIIVNRWGVTIYEWTDYETKEAGWDGRTSGGSEAAPGVYYFIVKAVGMDGIEYEETGPFHLVRGKE